MRITGLQCRNRESYFPAFENPPRVGNSVGWYYASIHSRLESREGKC
jgi:hypothetical protein